VEGELVPPDLTRKAFSPPATSRGSKGAKLWMRGRVKDVIINESGENVYPDELEDAFANIDEVQQLCAFGMDFGGPYEDITLIVYAENIERDRARMEALIAALSQRNAQLPIYKRVRRCFFSLSALPLTASMKVKRVRVKEDLGSGRFDAIEVDLAKRRVCGSIVVETPQVEKSDDYVAILKKIKEFFAEELCLDVEDITDRAHFVYDLGGDSLASLGVFSKIEENFDVIIMDDEYTSCTCAEDAALLLMQKLKGGGKANRRRITSFEESREYEALVARLKEAGDYNPYFVAHDSPLRIPPS
jgi:acyl carrier protein